MAGSKLIVKSFERFRGNHLGLSKLTREDGFTEGTQNVRFLDSLSVRKRPGFKIAGADYGEYRGLFTYTYLDKETGETRNDMLLLAGDGSYLSKVTRSYLGIHSANANSSVSFQLDTSSNLWEFDVLESGTSLSGWPKTYDTGFTNDSLELLAVVGTDISGESLWNAYSTFGQANSPAAVLDIDTGMSVGQWAQVNGDQVNVNTITVYSSGPGVNEFAVGDPIYFIELLPNSNLNARWAKREVTAVTATTITISGAPVTVDALDDLFAAAIPLLYMEGVNGEVEEPDIAPHEAGFVNATHTNLNDLLYYCANDSYPMKWDAQRFYAIGMPAAAMVNTTVSGTGLTGQYIVGSTYVQIDNQDIEVEGEFSADFVTTTLTNEGIVGNSYVPWVYVDPVSTNIVTATVNNTLSGINVIEVSAFGGVDINVGDSVAVFDRSSGTGLEIQYTIREVTAVVKTGATPSITVDGDTVDVNNNDIVLRANPQPFNYATARVNGAQSGVSEITVYTGHTLEVGDTAFFYDGISESYITREVVDQTTTTVTIDDTEGTVDVAAGDFLSANRRIRFYRSVADGASLYFWVEVPCPGLYLNSITTPVATAYTALADVDLGFLFEEPINIPSPPQKMSIVTTHQGLLIGSGGKENPNTIFFSEPFNSEAFPADRNSFDIPFTTSGSITGIASDEDTLVVFKERGRAVIRGELASLTVTQEVIEDGIGCLAHEALKQTPVGFIFPSRRGFQRMIRGQLDPQFAVRTLNYFRDQAYIQAPGQTISSSDEQKLVFRRATAINDFREGLYRCYVPAEQGVEGTKRWPNSNHKFLIYDYKQDAWSEDVVVEEQINAYGGWAVIDDDIYFSGVFEDDTSTLYSRLFKEHRRGDTLDGADNVSAINMVLPTSWHHFDIPTGFKSFLRFKTWQMAATEFIGAFTITLNSYLNFNDSEVHTTFPQSFPVATKVEDLKKLRGGQKGRSIKFEFTNNVIHETPIITGYEFEVALPYREEMKE